MRPVLKSVVLACVGGLVAVGFFVGRSYLATKPQKSENENGIGSGSATARTVVVLLSPDEPYATYGQSVLAGANAAVKVLANRAAAQAASDSKQASPPRDFRVVGHQMRGETGEEVAEELSHTLPLDRVDLLLIADDEARETTAMQAAEKLKIPIVYLLNGPCKTIASGKDASPFLWGTGFGLETRLEPLFISVSDKLSVPDKDLTILFVGGDNPNDRRIIRYARKSADDLGYKVLDTRFSDMRITDYYTFIRDIFASAPNVLFVSNPSRAGVLFLQQAGRLSVAKEMTVMGLDSFDAEFLNEIGPSAEGALTVGRYSPTFKSAQNDEFLTAFASGVKPPAPFPTETAFSAYESVLVADAAMAKAGDSDRKGWISRLPQLEITGPTGRIYVDEDNHVFHQPLFILRVDHGVPTVVDSLGEASHPRKERCALVKPPDVAPPSPPPADGDSAGFE